MKKIIVFAFFLCFLFLFGCGNKLGEDVIEVPQDNEISQKMMIIQNKLLNGEITQEQAQEMAQNIGKYSLDVILGMEKNEEILKDLSFPIWVMELGIIEPEGLSLDYDISKITSVDNKNELFDSVLFVYKGEYEKSMEEAGKIAESAGLSVSKDFEKAKEVQESSPDIFDQMGDEIKSSMEGIIYSNYSVTDMNVDYLMSVSVQGDGTLTINVSNHMQMNEALNTR